MDRLLPDLTYSLRRLARAPGFTAIALVTLALGIGANAAIFSVVKSVLLRPLPYGQPDRVVMIWSAVDKGETTWLSAPEILSYGRDGKSFESVSAYEDNAANLTGGAEPERVIAARVTPDIFKTLGVSPIIGRVFAQSEAVPGPTSVVILGHGLWQRRFGGEKGIVGRQIMVNGTSRTVIGVLPADFRLPLDFGESRPAELLTPMSLADPDLEGWGNRGLIGVGRMRAGVTANQANADLRSVEEGWVRTAIMRDREGLKRKALPVRDFVLGDIRSALYILMGAVAAVLLIACANVANLMLARSDERHREIAIRTSLGASRGVLVRQLMTESVLLSVIGGLLGTGLAWAATRLLVSLHPPGVPRVGDIGLDAGVFGFVLVIAVATGILFGLAPALDISKPDLSRSLKEGGRTGSVGKQQQRFRDGLAVAQMAFSVLLLIGAMLLVRSFGQIQRIDLGFNSRDALTFRIALPPTSYPESKDVIAFMRDFRHTVEQLPGVRSVGGTRLLPLTGTIGDWSITLEGHVRADGENPNGDWQVVTPGYFETMGVKLVSGRLFSDADREDAPPVAVINESMAKKYWKGDPVGKRFHIGSANQPWITVVGVIGQVRHNAVIESPRDEMYVPHAQWAAAGANTPRGVTFVVRTVGDPVALVPHVRRAVREADPNLPVAEIRTLKRVVDDSLSQPRFTTLLLGFFAALALSLAMIGIYGVISLLVTRRTQEIGIRMALGATSRSILNMVVRRGMILTATGVVLGLVGALWVTRALTSMLYGIGRFDAVTFATAPLVLGAVALLACAVPALRAAAMDPLSALREE